MSVTGLVMLLRTRQIGSAAYLIEVFSVVHSSPCSVPLNVCNYFLAKVHEDARWCRVEMNVLTVHRTMLRFQDHCSLAKRARCALRRVVTSTLHSRVHLLDLISVCALSPTCDTSANN